MKKSRIQKLIPIANQALLDQYSDMQVRYERGANQEEKAREKIKDSAILRKEGAAPYHIKSNYDGKVAGFGIAVALSGLSPALAMYYNESGEVNTRPILEIITRIIREDATYDLPGNENTAKALLDHALTTDSLKALTKIVIEAAVALKQIVRTYDLK